MPTKAAITAVGVLLLVRVAIGLFDEDKLLQINSRWVHNLMINEVKCEEAEGAPPEVIVMGTSRARTMGPRIFARHLGRPPQDVINLATTGADFSNMETVLRRNPAIVRNARVLIMDIMPMQIMNHQNYDERGGFFLRYASLQQRIHAQGLVSKAAGLGDLVLGVGSHAQDAYQWRMGIARLDMTEPEWESYVHGVSLEGFNDWMALVDDVGSARLQGRLIEECAKIMFTEPDVVPNQIAALKNIIAMTPEDCVIVGVWLPFREDVQELVNRSTTLSASEETFKKVIASVEVPKFTVRWFETPEDMGLTANDYTDDGVHFSPSGVDRLAQTYATIAQQYLPTEP